MKYSIPILLFLSICLAACQPSASDAMPPTGPTKTPVSSITPLPSPTSGLDHELQTYLDQALDLIQDHSVYAGEVDWESIRQQAYLSALQAKTLADLYPVVEIALHASGDRHSYVIPPAEANAYFEAGPDESIPEIPIELIQNRIGSIRVPVFLSGNLEMALDFADQLQDDIRSLDEQGACGWVIDLRSNEGGNGFAMLLGLSPLSQHGTVGMYTYKDGQTRDWILSGNQVFLGDELVMELDRPGYQLLHPGAPVVILTSAATTSAGEFLAIAFRGWENTRSFGQKTLGRTTAPQGYLLEDGAMLGISVAYFSDHSGKVYPGEIVPEETIRPRNGNPNYMDYNVPRDAIDWLLGQPACTG